ncbi:alpha-amylase family glycosyl hydrolase [Vibrio sp. JC009]|uniref:alpha-amylase family glycosyl hydrolase n=1 Tax=Vibrio sp. JC009 TaxID=2912314 RepID=UPI0023B0561C|nr:alpha-amylase family glycosyl hydrolase [Vibrio sp. JC009]WED24195.1 alpha-amylase family glycosyl hydrolase [Vibrio sp. JC009]
MDFFTNARVADYNLFSSAKNKTNKAKTDLTAEKTDVILHAFDWPYSYVAESAKMISEMGYRSVLVSPPMKSFKHDEGTDWWQRYQPQDYRVIDNQLGNTRDFMDMVNTLAEYGVQVYADVVFNHMANEAYRRKDLQYPCSTDIKRYSDDWDDYQSLLLYGDLSKPLFDKEHFMEAFGIKDWKDRWEVQNGRITGGEDDPGLPTLKVCDYVVEQQQNYLKALKDMGVKGFRIDAAKHMTLEHLLRVWTSDIAEDVHIFGEIITDGGASQEEYELFLEPYLAHTKLSAYDFPLFNMVHGAFQKDGNMESLINPYSFGQALSNSRAITFAITHDIPNNDVFMDLILDEQDEWLAYSYILGRDGGVPLVYTDLDTSGIRGRNDRPRWLGVWKDPRMAKMIQFHNLVHGEDMVPIVADKDVVVFARGEKGLVAINKSETSVVIDFQWHKDMTDLLQDEVHPLEGDELNLVLGGKSCMMLV